MRQKMTEYRSIVEQIAKKIRDAVELSEAEKDWVAKLVMAYGQQMYERTGSMFIHNWGGETGSDGLPEWLYVVPTFGVDHRLVGCYRIQRNTEN